MAKPVLTVKVYRSRSANPKERFRWVARTANGRKVAGSLEGYTDESHAYDMAERLLGGQYDVRFEPNGA